MRILVLSDLHREFWAASEATQKYFSESLSPSLAVCKPDVVVLAGDIDTGDRGIQWASRSFMGLPVIYVPGNHEGYGHSIDRLEEKIREACTSAAEMHFLNADQVVLGGVRFLGATLWTDMMLHGRDLYSEVFRAAGQLVNDYKRIRVESGGYRKIRPADTCFWHSEQRSWLKKQLAAPFAGKTVVVTHMAPSAESIPHRYRHELLSAVYASDLEEIAFAADLWIHGHVNDSVDYTLGKCRVISNPLGYPLVNGPFIAAENNCFNPNFLVTL